MRLRFSDVGPIVAPDGLEDEQAPFLSDIPPTGGMDADDAAVVEGDTVAIWICGPVGLFAVRSARTMGARVSAIDHHPRRLELERGLGAETVHYAQTAVREALLEMTGGVGPDAMINAVGMHSHGFAVDDLVDAAKQKTGIGADRGHVLREAILAGRKGGRVSIPGVYGGLVDRFPIGAVMEKGLQVRAGQTHVHRYARDLLRRIEAGEIDTTFLISHRLPLESAAEGYANFRDDQDDWTKVVLKTWA